MLLNFTQFIIHISTMGSKGYKYSRKINKKTFNNIFNVISELVYFNRVLKYNLYHVEKDE